MCKYSIRDIAIVTKEKGLDTKTRELNNLILGIIEFVILGIIEFVMLNLL
jgi:hypothetical protein